MKPRKSRRSRLASIGSTQRFSVSREPEDSVVAQRQVKEMQLRLKAGAAELARAELERREMTREHQNKVESMQEQLQRKDCMIKELHSANAELGRRLTQQAEASHKLSQQAVTKETVEELWTTLQEIEQVLNHRAERSLALLEDVRRGIVNVYKLAETHWTGNIRRGAIDMLNKIEDNVESVVELLAKDGASQLRSQPTPEKTRDLIASPINRVLDAQEERIRHLELEKEVQAASLKKLQAALQDQITQNFRLPSPTISSQFPSPEERHRQRPLNDRIAQVYFSSGESRLQEQISALDEEIVELQQDLTRALTAR